MSKNDQIHLEMHFKNWLQERAAGLTDVDPFEYYCVEQFLKSFTLSDEEIEYGLVGAPSDGGIDAMYFLVNREVVRVDTVLDPKGASTIHLILMQIKNSNEGFKPTEIDKVYFFVDDLLDLTRPVAHEMKQKYHGELIELIQTFKDKYQFIAAEFPSITVEYYYVTRGDEIAPHPTAHTSAKRLKERINQHLSKAEVSVNFVNLQALLEQVQKRPLTVRKLQWTESPMQTEEGYIGLVSLNNYHKFIQDENGDLSQRIFESNVRGFQQSTSVNKQIRESLETYRNIDFWLLNNGITILATKAGTIGGPRQLSLADPQIVNGLQTSREIYDYFIQIKPQNENRNVLVRVIQTEDEDVYDKIVKATNSQNDMPPASLRATDRIHRQIEELFKQYGLFYDRRKGFHKDQGKPIGKIVAVNQLLQALVAIVLQRPDDARARPGNYLKDESRYESVFGKDKHPLSVYLKCIHLMRRIDEFLTNKAESRIQEAERPFSRADKRNVRFYVATCLACELTGKAKPTGAEMLGIDTTKINDSSVESCFDVVWKVYVESGRDDDIAKSPKFSTKILEEMISKFPNGLNGGPLKSD
jgi:hypothetical protein